jgi:hypothetical protein
VLWVAVCDFMCSQLTIASAHLAEIVCLPPVLFPHMLALGNQGWPASLWPPPSSQPPLSITTHGTGALLWPCFIGKNIRRRNQIVIEKARVKWGLWV